MVTESALAKSAPETGQVAETANRGPVYKPSVDIVETAEELTLFAEVPGATGQDIDLDLREGRLTLRAKVHPRQPAGRKYLLQEYGVGDYQHTFVVGESIDTKNVTAELRDGVLAVHLPKLESVKPRRIDVRTG